jgi:hypothetical protein
MLLIALIAMAAVALVGIGALSARIVDRTRAQTAADAAALAATTGGRDAAARLAAANGGVLVAYTAAGDWVLVTVAVDGERATARATDGP